jgi:hypothetical protein
MLVRIRTETYADPSIHFDTDPDQDPNPETYADPSIHFDADPDQDPNPTPSFTIVEKSE